LGLAALALFAGNTDATLQLQVLVIPTVKSKTDQSKMDALVAAVAALPEQHVEAFRICRLELFATLAAGATHGTCMAMYTVWDQYTGNADASLLMRAALLTSLQVSIRLQ
jgi:hypothetical protein